ncbi:uncharacterized protein LOC34619778 [Cyclospora cayetanensis]|uniref:alanine dehydrogenase n=2 Tax=Cyclospora cayetanensis TaxID=88456 RepID=A0A1D3CX09_9EIME|nr:uncharacterized protein LOC34619778 [Cyclospora cayetanensis]OEH75726.1 alanine dehydrogenase [Cyclospora cayetanensis]
MIVGCPKEAKPQEGRVGLLPWGVAELVRNGHTVLIQKGAGLAAGAADAQYVQAGAEIVDSPREIFGRADMIVKVKEPMPEEFIYFRSGQIVFTYFHFAASRQLTEAMIQTQAVCIAYETVEEAGSVLALLEPMSEVAGRMAIQEGMHYLSSSTGGKGVLLGGVPGVPHGKVLIIGGGVVGLNAAKAAAGFGANVVIMDKSLPRLRYLDDILPRNCTTRYSCEEVLKEELLTTDLVIGAVLLPGYRTPKILRKDHLNLMKPGTVIVDVAVDHGGCCETSRMTYHEAPIYTVNNIVHYGVANMPGAVPVTSTTALTNATIPYIVQLANLGWREACAKNKALRKGINILEGKVIHKGIGEAFDLPVFELRELPDGGLKPVLSA